MIKELKMFEAHHWIAVRFKNPNKNIKYSQEYKTEYKMPKKRKKTGTFFEDSDSTSLQTQNFNTEWKIDI